MVEHVKLEIAIQICAEKINDIFEKIDATDDDYLRRVYEQELILAFDEKNRVFNGEVSVINKVLNERGGK
ncbi:MAG: hypothetical protein IJX17_05150 [Clostridia bacterium]|nr:hypothetical protein [Clostridia bacterium]